MKRHKDSKMYGLLDVYILNSVISSGSCRYKKSVRDEALRIANATGRDVDRVIDGRTQALRKAGKIEYVRGKWCIKGD